MSRIRLGTIAAFAGILITTGGCAGSATAPEAATARGASVNQSRATNPTTADDAANGRGKGDKGGETTDATGFSASGGFITVGG